MHTAEIRQTLESQLADVLARHQKLDDHLHNRDREPPADSQDRAQFLENDEVLEALDDGARATIGALKAALRRLEAGTYGSCAQCGAAIPAARLRALPTAATCTACAT